MKKNNLLISSVLFVFFCFFALTIVSCDLSGGGNKLTNSQENESHIHNYVQIAYEEPTCDKHGYELYSCECGEKDERYFEPLGHNEVIDEAKESTCSEPGLTEGIHCSRCNEIIVEQYEIPTLKHDEIVDTAKNATCEENGLSEGKHCSVCNTVLVAQEEVPALGHTEVIDKAKEATCEGSGLSEGKHCSVCNTVLVAQEEVPALGHTEVIDVAVESTCKSTGLSEGKHCKTCGEVFVNQDVIEMLDHSFSGIGSDCIYCGCDYFTQQLELTLSEDGESYSVTGIGTSTSKCLVMPTMYRGKPVTSIGPSAFSNNNTFETIKISESITSIDKYAFHNCESLVSIVVDENNDVYDSRNNCNAIIETKTNKIVVACSTTIIPNDIEIIGTSVFSAMSFTSFTLPDSVRIIEDYAFASCTNLETINFGNNLTSIGLSAFNYCTSLNGITIPSSVTYIGSFAFNNCVELNTVYYDGNIKQWFNIEFTNHFSNPSWYAEELYMLDENKESKLISNVITLPNDLTSISKYTFSGFTFLESIVIPNGVTSIDNGAFYGCTYLKNVEVPSTLESIGDRAFYQCYSLVEFNIPSGVTNIGCAAFYDCNDLVEIVIPEGVTTIYYDTFKGCQALKSVVIPNSVTTIGERAFSGCELLSNLIIGNKVTTIEEEAFYRCYSLIEVNYTGNKQQWQQITIVGSRNDKIANASISYNYIIQ